MSKIKLSSLVSFYVVLSISSVTLAEDYYSILRREYGTANSNISESDFDRPGAPTARICLEVFEDRPTAENYVMISSYTRVLEGQGPLLPKTTITKIIYRPYNSDVFAGNQFDLVKTDFENKRVVSAQNDGGGKITWTISIRKKGDYLIFEREYQFGEDSTKTSYGYCFHRETKN